MIKRYRGLFFFLLITLPFCVAAETSVVSNKQCNDGYSIDADGQLEIHWYCPDADGNLQIHLYFFWYKYCPHCHRAKPLLPKLEKIYPWLKIHSFEVSTRHNVVLYKAMSNEIGYTPSSVPGFLFCEDMITGYGTEKTTGAQIKEELEACYEDQQ